MIKPTPPKDRKVKDSTSMIYLVPLISLTVIMLFALAKAIYLTFN